MIRPIRAITAALQDDPTVDQLSLEEPAASDDTELEVLVRHAFRQEAQPHDAKSVWKRLSGRVRGPFGALAIEEPALCGEVMPVLADSLEPAERQPDSLRHSLFRTAEATFSMR